MYRLQRYYHSGQVIANPSTSTACWDAFLLAPRRCTPPLDTINLKIWNPSKCSQDGVPGPLHTFGWYVAPPPHTHLQYCHGPRSNLLGIKLPCSAPRRKSILPGRALSEPSPSTLPL